VHSCPQKRVLLTDVVALLSALGCNVSCPHFVKPDLSWIYAQSNLAFMTTYIWVFCQKSNFTCESIIGGAGQGYMSFYYDQEKIFVIVFYNGSFWVETETIDGYLSMGEFVRVFSLDKNPSAP